MEELEKSLKKIRHHTNSSLENQKKPASLLVALESTFAEQGQSTKVSPTTYFAALLTTATQLTSQETPDGSILVATLYLLSLVTPHVPAAVIRSKYEDVFTAVSPVMSSYSDDSGVVRSVLGILEPVFIALGPQQLNQIGVSQVYNGSLALVVDPRPKVRKRAQDFVQAVLKNPPQGSSSQTHPFTSKTSQWIIKQLEEIMSDGKKKSKKKDDSSADTLATKAMSLCTVIRSSASKWSEQSLAAMLPVIVRLPSLSSPYLTSQSYTLLQALFSTSPDSFSTQSILQTLNVLLNAKPNDKDQLILPGWLSGFEAGIVSLGKQNSQQSESIIEQHFDQILNLLNSEFASIRFAAVSLIEAMIRYGISDATIRKGPDGILGQLYHTVFNAFQSLNFRSSSSVPHLIAVSSALVSRSRLRVNDEPVARRLTTELLKVVELLRNDKSFEFRDTANDMIGMVIEVCGAPWVLDVLPLNLHESLKNETGRAWLLPILAKRTTNTSLLHFISFFIPLSEHLFSRYEAVTTGPSSSSKSSEMEAKIYETLIEQIWATLPGYCDLPTDLPQAFEPSFLEQLANLLYQRPTLRPPILRALQLIVERNTTLTASSAPQEIMRQTFGIDQNDARKNVEILKGQAKNLLFVLFNVFESVGREKGGAVLECVSAYMSILDPNDIFEILVKVEEIISSSIPTAEASLEIQTQEESGQVYPAAQSMMDLVVTMVPFTDIKSATAIYELVMEGKLLTSKDLILQTKPIISKDLVLQKKAYRTLSRLCTESKSGKQVIINNMSNIVQCLNETQKSVLTAAKRDRTIFLASLVPILPQDQLHFVPSLIPESILATKENNEKTREAAYDLILALAEKMNSGGTVKLSLVPGIEQQDEDEGMDEEKPASLEEYFKMITANLDETSPHMISATITALSRLLYEYHESLSREALSDIITVMCEFVNSNNREVAKSAIGSIKVVIVTLSNSAVMPHLDEIVPALLKWSSQHTNHFKVKIRHIFERLIRKFSYEDIEALVGEENSKLLQNIRKRQLRAKRKRTAKASDGEESEADEEPAPKTSGKNAYEDVLYGSESELDSEDDDDGKQHNKPEAKGKAKGKGKARQTYIDEDEDVLDLLDPKSMNKVISTDPSARESNEERRRKQLNKYDTDRSGKLVINDEDKKQAGSRNKRKSMDMEQDDNDDKMDIEESTNAYLEAIQGEDGFSRDASGKVRFNKPKTGNRRFGDDENDDMEPMVDKSENDGPRQRKKKQAERVGSEFKAKRAGGDVKKGGMSPYAYVPLNSMTKKKGAHKKNVDIVGRNNKRQRT